MGVDGQVSRKESLFIRLLGAVMFLVVFPVLFIFLFPDVRSRATRPRTQALNNLRNVGLALQNYATRNHGFLPLHQLRVPPNNSPQSWRIAVLPYLDQVGK